MWSRRSWARAWRRSPCAWSPKPVTRWGGVVGVAEPAGPAPTPTASQRVIGLGAQAHGERPSVAARPRTIPSRQALLRVPLPAIDAGLVARELCAVEQQHS